MAIHVLAKDDRDGDNESAFLGRACGGTGRRSGLKSRCEGAQNANDGTENAASDSGLPSGLPRELAQVVDAWPRLPEHVRRTIVDLTRVGRI